jgi:hypothetical protein
VYSITYSVYKFNTVIAFCCSLLFWSPQSPRCLTTRRSLDAHKILSHIHREKRTRSSTLIRANQTLAERQCPITHANRMANSYFAFLSPLQCNISQTTRVESRPQKDRVCPISTSKHAMADANALQCKQHQLRGG